MDETQNFKLSGAPETSGQISIPQAARSLGLDTYTLYTLIQRERINPITAVGGEYVLSEQDVNRLAAKE
jgi:predicted site-specific integrase-resolvase